jgi:3-deoxy-manno-octulosonate cytidylyltransferase (CMP-KDO synthetase)
MKSIGVIPARYSSTRLPGKMLADIHGKPLIQWVWENITKSKKLNDIIIACDDE